jgi:mercuric ion binding protein
LRNAALGYDHKGSTVDRRSFDVSRVNHGLVGSAFLLGKVVRKMRRMIIVAAGALVLAAGGIGLSVTDLTAAQAATPHSERATFAVANMTCATCPITVKTAMKAVPGVQSVNVNFEKKTAVVVFDPSRAKPAAIAAASTSVGFPAKLVR